MKWILNGKIRPIYFKYLSAAFGSAMITRIYSIVDMAMVGAVSRAGGNGGTADHFRKLWGGKRPANQADAPAGSLDDHLFRCVLDGVEHGSPEFLYSHFHGFHSCDPGDGSCHHSDICAVIPAASI